MCTGNEWKLVATCFPHQSQLWDGSTQAPLLAVGNIYWRDGQRQTVSEVGDTERNSSSCTIYSKKGSRHDGLWESNKSHSGCETGRHKQTCGLAGRVNEYNLSVTMGGVGGPTRCSHTTRYPICSPRAVNDSCVMSDGGLYWIVRVQLPFKDVCSLFLS